MGGGAPGSLSTLSGVIVPTCENMWGVLIFLRFFFVVGHAGVWQSLVIVFVSFLSSLATTMSLSAMATNGPVQAGGAYYIISRALGHKLGGAVGTTYYLGLSLLAVLEVLGAVEVMLAVEPGLDMGLPVEAATRVWAALLTFVLGGMVWGGMQLVSKAGLFFATIVGLTLLSYYAGLIAAPLPGVSPAVTGLSTATLSKNWGPSYTDGVTFSDVLSVFFPCFTGILSGANRANFLKTPEVSIPWGTLAAISISFVMYASYMIMWGAVADREYLKNGPSAYYYAESNRRRLLAGSAGDSMGVVSEIAWPLALPTQIGIIIASLSQALQCLISAPGVLNAIAVDGTVPFLTKAAFVDKRGEPVAALAATVTFCVCASMIGSLDLVAPLLSICFLAAYSALNFSTFALGLTKAPSWRPTWRYFHWSVGLFGFLLCTTLAFIIRWYFALVAVAMLAALVAYIESAQVRVDWGSALGGIRLDLATAAMLDLAHERKHSSNWRPQLLCLPSWPGVVGGVGTNEAASNPVFSAKGGDLLEYDDIHVVPPFRKKGRTSHEALLCFASQLKKGRGLCVVAEIELGVLSRDRGLSRRVADARETLEKKLAAANVRGFAHVMVSPTYKQGIPFAIQGLGFGGLEPNTVLLGWPRRNKLEFDEDVDDDADEETTETSAKTLVDTVCECTASEKAVLLCMDPQRFPSSEEKLTGFVDVWWVVHDGGLLLMIAHLLLRHRTWEKCKLRVHTVLQKAQDPHAVRRSLQAVLRDFRIDAEVSVVEAGDDADMYAYTHDWTMRKEQAEMFREELLLAQGVKKLETGVGDGGVDGAAGTPPRSGDSTPLRLGGGNTSPSPLGRDATPTGSGGRSPERAESENGADSVAENETNEGPKNSNLRRAFPSEIDMLVRDHGELECSESMDVRHLRRKADAVKAGLALNADGTSPIAKGHASLASIFDLGDLVAAAPADSGKSTSLSLSLGPKVSDAKSDAGGESSATHPAAPFGKKQTPPSMPSIPGSPVLSPVAFTMTTGAASVEDVRVDVGAVAVEAAGTIPVPSATKKPPPEKPKKAKRSVSFGGNDETRTFTTTETPPPNVTIAAHTDESSWVTDAQGPAALNRIIREKSEDAQLVIVNLPDPDSLVMANPAAYARYVEAIVRGLPRVVYVHGTGREVYMSAR